MQLQNRRMVLAIILATYLMIILDASVVITALPKIHDGLHFSAPELSWVQSAYALTFGGFLLLGARAGDILGRRTVFLLGIGVFTFASFWAGLAQSPAELLAARAPQGVGGGGCPPTPPGPVAPRLPGGGGGGPGAPPHNAGAGARRGHRPGGVGRVVP